MSTKLQILQGAGQIGGNIVLFEGEHSRVILDFGIPLTELDGSPTNMKIDDERVKKYLPDIPDLYKDIQKKETAVFVSHAHPDHYGLARYLNKSVPVYTKQITKDLIEKASHLLYNNLFNDINFQIIEDKIELADFIVYSYLVNHSIAGACAYKVVDKTSRKSVLYSGDIRFHGRGVNEIINKENENLDYFILEGTTLSRDEKRIRYEKDIENSLFELFNEDRPNIIACTPLNLDRMISVYKACQRANKILVLDPYSAYILETYTEKDAPKCDSKGIKVFCMPNSSTDIVLEDKNMRKKCGINKIDKDNLIMNANKCVIKYNYNTFNYLTKKLNMYESNFIYSYWEGYLEKPNYHTRKYKNQLKNVHTSGHITQTDLVKLVNELNPTHILPIHTTSTERFKELFPEKTIEEKQIIL